MSARSMFVRSLVCPLLLIVAAPLVAAETAFRTDDGDAKLPWFVLQAGEFPPAGSAHAVSGELIGVDHIRRKGAIRHDRDGVQRSDEYDKSLDFTMLPYGSIVYHGAPAELRDVPIGTHLHGQFYLDPKPSPNTQPAFNQVLLFEDDFSFATARKRLWRVDAVAVDKGQLTVTGVGADGTADRKPTLFQINRATRVWKGIGLGTLADVAAGQQILLNLTVCTLKGPGRATDIWIDAESRAAATAGQREVHCQYQREHGLAARIDEVDNQQGIVTATLFGGIDPSLVENFRVNEYITAAVADDALRTHDQVNDCKRGPILSVEQLTPGQGSSGLRVRFKPEVLLEGYRPKLIVRLFWGGWPIDDLPREERLYY